MSRFRSLFRFRIRLTFKLIVVIVFLLLMGSAIFGWFLHNKELSPPRPWRDRSGAITCLDLLSDPPSSYWKGDCSHGERSKGELGETVNIPPGDEIGDLAKAFNQMTLHLRETIDHLQRNVEGRTHQLAETVEELNQTKVSNQKILKDLKSSQKELEKANRTLSEVDLTKLIFIGDASHELKTPLTAIKANIDFILTEKEGKLPDYLRSYLSTIQRNTNRIQMSIDRLLDLTRIKSGHLHLSLEPIRLSAVVGEYIDETRSEDKNLSVQVDIPEDLFIYADKNGLHDIFTNLLSNAFKFTSDGGQIKIIAHQEDESISQRDSGYWDRHPRRQD